MVRNMPSLRGLPAEVWGIVVLAVVIFFCIYILNEASKLSPHAQATAQGGIDALKLLNDFGPPVGAGIILVLLGLLGYALYQSQGNGRSGA